MTLHELQLFELMLEHIVVGGCPLQPCRNDGTCIPDETQSYNCTCPGVLAGRNCTDAELNGLQYLIVDIPKKWLDARRDCISLNYSV